jgi:lysophospholipase L1-like esterase
MIGFFSALVESRLRLRVGPGPLTLALDGRLPPPDEDFKSRAKDTLAVGIDRKFDPNETARQKTVAAPLLAIGDSWLFDQWEREYGVSRPNMMKSLLPLGYKDLASGIKDFAYAGRRLSDMAQPQFLNSVKDYIADEQGLKAILLSGGGNDVVSGLPGQQPLFKMLQPRSAGAPELNEAEVARFMDGTLADYYKKILNALTASTRIPILIHGYDHPIPDGRGDRILTIQIGPWIQPIVAQRGYDFRPPGVVDLALARDVVRRLIDRFNTMIGRVAAAYPNVHHVNLTGTLAKAYGNDYKTYWNNELHPRENGFDLLAKLIEAKLKSLKI